MPLGLTGMTPLAAVGPVSVGPSHSGAERSSLEAPHVTVFVDALQSLLQRKAVLRLLLMRPQARLHGTRPCNDRWQHKRRLKVMMLSSL